MVPYTLQWITQGVTKWREIHQAIQGWNGANAWDEFKTILLKSRLIQKPCDPKVKKPCACKICREIGHIQEEHKDECPHCEGSHPAEECPTGQVTCFMCEGVTHFPAQCQIYPKVQEITKQQKEALRKCLEESMMEEVIAIHVDKKKDIIPSIARRKEKSISETSRQQK